MRPHLSKRALVGCLIFLGSCSDSSGSIDTTSTSSAAPTTAVASPSTSSSSTTTTIYYLYPTDFVEDFTRGCTEVGGVRSACLCVIDRAQSDMAFEDFSELVRPEGELVDGQGFSFEPGSEILALVEACRV